MSYNDDMLRLTRKQRELVERETLILDVTRDLLLDLGYHGLTMDRIAEAMEYSKGTVYQHFPCKEEVLTELALRINERRFALFERAVTFEGRPRERVAAIGEAVSLFAHLSADDLRILGIINSEVVIQKVSQPRQERVNGLTLRAMGILAGIVRDAIAKGDLALPEGVVPEDLAFGLWSLTEGGFASIVQGAPLAEVGVGNAFFSVMKNCEILLDGYGWRPLSTEWDFAETRERIRREIFDDEAARVAVD